MNIPILHAIIKESVTRLCNYISNVDINALLV